MKNKFELAIITTALLVATNAGATDLGHGVSFKAFGTLGLVHSNNDDADYITSTHTQPAGAGYSDSTSYKVDTRLGAQFDWQASEKLSFTTQLLTKQFEDKTWTPRIEAGYLNYELISELELRVGRIRPAVYMLSDFLDVNFANPWIRPPIEHYGVIPFSYINGADLLWRTQTGEISWLVQPYIGKVKADTVSTVIDNEIAGINVTANQGDFTFRVGYMMDRFQFSGDQMDQMIGSLQGLCSVDPVACDLADKIDSKDSKSDYISLGGSWDNGDYFISGEYSKVLFDVDFVPEMQSWYLTAGMRIESWTPYVTYAKFKIDDSARYTGSTNPMTNMMITQMRNSNMQGQHSVSLGVRYDFLPNMALKAQWDHVTTDCNDSQAGTCGGMFGNKSNGFSDKSRDADVVSVSVDFVF